MSMPKEPKYTPFFMKEIKEQLMNDVETLIDNYLEEFQNHIDRWEKYCGDIKDVLEIEIENLKEDLEEMKIELDISNSKTGD